MVIRHFLSVAEIRGFPPPFSVVICYCANGVMNQWMSVDNIRHYHRQEEEKLLYTHGIADFFPPIFISNAMYHLNFILGLNPTQASLPIAYLYYNAEKVFV